MIFELTLFGKPVFSFSWAKAVAVEEDEAGQHVHLGVNTEVAEDDEPAQAFGFSR